MKNLVLLAGVCALAFAGAYVRGEEKTFNVSDDGSIKNWLALPAIQLDENAANHDEGSQKAFFDKEFFPKQKAATPAEGEKVKIANNEVAWKAVALDNDVWEFEAQDNSLYIGVTYIVCEDDIPNVNLSIGSDDSSLWCLNGTEIVRVYSGRGVEKDQDKSPAVTLKKGKNVLYMAVINGGGPTGATARFVDKDGGAVKKIKISLTPPAK
jgi:hypothetical protein